MATCRKDQVDRETPGYYHLISRCVRRAFLCGEDELTGKSFEHRRQWIEDRIIELADVFAIEVYAYAVMHNHYHLVVYSKPLAPQKWTNQDVAERWLKAFPGKLNDPKFEQQRQLRLQAIINDEVLQKEYRERLGNLSWLMKCINEPIAKSSNAEDFVKGHFWEARFTSQALLDESSALACMAYVDLNPIRAGISDCIEKSEHTSIKKRVNKLTKRQLKQSVKAMAGQVKERTMVIKLEDYVLLVEWTGKAIAHPDKAVMPAEVASVLTRLNINHTQWTRQITSYGSNYFRFVGCWHKIQAKTEEINQHWIQGKRNIQKLFCLPI